VSAIPILAEHGFYLSEFKGRFKDHVEMTKFWSDAISWLEM